MVADEVQMQRKDDFAALVRSEDVVLIVRCGGRNGACGRIRALLFDDRTVRWAPIRCHVLDDWLFLNSGVKNAFVRAKADKARVQRAGRRFKPPFVIVGPTLPT